MGRACERTGCAHVATAALALDPRRFVVWVGDLQGSGTSVTALCTGHADRLVVPLGWQRRDVRDTPRLVAVPSLGADAVPSETSDLLSAAASTPLLARAFRAARAAG